MSVHLLNELSFIEGGLLEEDVERAKEYANTGDPVAQYHLALMFDIGQGVKRNPREAEKLYKASAEQGHANAAYYLARMYSLETSGIDKNQDLAQQWYKKAVDLGHLEAKKKILP